MNNDKFLRSWVNNKKEGLVVRYHNYCNLLADEAAVYSYGHHFPLAVWLGNGDVLLNGDRYSVSTSTHQNEIRRCVEQAGLKYCVVPFSAIASALNKTYQDVDSISNFDIKFKEDEHYRTVKYKDPETGEEKEREEHLLGGSLIKFEKRLFLSSTDPGAPWGRGFFLTELKNNRVRNLEEAFRSMKPNKVKEAEKKEKTILRQGEWFFIKEAENYPELKKKKHLKVQMKDVVKKHTFLPVDQSDRREHHQVRDQFFVEKKGRFVSGRVRHTGGDHHSLMLGKKSWWMACHNVQINSWQGSGKVD